MKQIYQHLPEALIAIGLLVCGSKACSEAQASDHSKTLTVLRELPDTPGPRLRIAKAIDNATDKKHEKALLISVAWYESNLMGTVAFCERKGDEGKAIGLWQSWTFQKRKDCPSIYEQAEEAIRHLRLTMNACKVRGDLRATMKGAVSMYATGRSCFWDGAEKRAKLWQKIMQRPL